jgi:hypothetical protein
MNKINMKIIISIKAIIPTFLTTTAQGYKNTSSTSKIKKSSANK